MVKNLYKGVFVYPHIGYTIMRAAYSEKQAKILMARVIAKKQGVFISDVMKWLKDNKEKYLIKTEIKWEEENGNIK
jgi:hypothetical protein